MKGYRPHHKPHVSLIAFSYKTVQSILVHRVETKKTSLYTKWMALCDTSFFSLDSIIVSNIVPEPYSPQTGSFAGSRQEEPYCAEAEWKRKWRSIVEFLLSCTLYSSSLKNMVLFPHLISSCASLDPGSSKPLCRQLSAPVQRVLLLFLVFGSCGSPCRNNN